jgi:hypothetical protein
MTGFLDYLTKIQKKKLITERNWGAVLVVVNLLNERDVLIHRAAIYQLGLLICQLVDE